MIGIGVTTHNRSEVAEKTIAEIRRFNPGARLVVVDDASDEPFLGADYRFETNVGIARAKNKCIELLEDCTDIFLFDDDSFPLKKGWERPYIESPEPHLMYLFKDFKDKPRLNDAIELYRDSKHFALSHPRGCMLYIHKSVLDKVGGMDTRYARWGNEHVDFSNRVFNAGLTSFRYADVSGSDELIYSGDEHESVVTTVQWHERKEYLTKTKSLLDASRNSFEYMEYRERINDISGQKNIVLTCYFTKQLDTQRNKKWEFNYDEVKDLRWSVIDKNMDMVLLVDEMKVMDNNDYVHIEEVDTCINPYFQRWLSYYQFLREHPEIDNVFCVDATDVTILKNPFLYIEPGKIYCGDEPTVLSTRWMVNHTNEPEIMNYIRRNARLPLLNAGVIGGSREDIMSVAHDIAGVFFDNNNKSFTDMGAFNYVLRTKYAEKLEHGRKVTTVFKKFDTENKESWICHK